MRKKSRTLDSKTYHGDATYVVEYLRMADVSFYGNHIAQWIYEDLLWKEDVAKDLETVIYNELIKVRGK